MSASHQRGITLIELIVTVGIFAIMLVVISNLFTRYVFQQRRDISERAIEEQIRFGLEVFSREVRTGFGSTYALGSSAQQDAGTDMLVFRNQDRKCVAYKVFDTVWLRAESTADTGDCGSVPYGGFSALTDKKRIKITSLKFLPAPGVLAGISLQRQGFVTVVIKADSTSARITIPEFHLQDTITSRQVKAYRDL